MTCPTTETEARTQKWAERFGTLEIVTVREGKKGTYVTFKLSTPKFAQHGIAFGDVAQAIIAAGVGARAWMKGPIDRSLKTIGGVEKMVGDFTAVYFSLAGDEAAAA